MLEFRRTAWARSRWMRALTVLVVALMMGASTWVFQEGVRLRAVSPIPPSGGSVPEPGSASTVIGLTAIPEAASAVLPDVSSVGRTLSTGRFTENVGQFHDPAVRFYGSVAGVRVGFATGAVVLAVEHATPPGAPVHAGLPWRPESAPPEDPRASGVVVRLRFVGSNPVAPEGVGELASRSNFLLGSDPASWRTDVRSYREIVYRNLYEAIDLVYRQSHDGLKYEWAVRPGADLGRIEIAYDGAEGLTLDSSGAVIARTGLDDLRDTHPVVIDPEMAGVRCDFDLRTPRSIGLRCEGWDGRRPLVIDPLVYSTYLGGSDEDFAGPMAVDASGDAFVAGNTLSPDFPTTPGAYDLTRNGPSSTYDVFVTKVSAMGGGLVYSTYLGGNDGDYAMGLVLDGSGNAVVAGYTRSPDFPVTPGAYDPSWNGFSDGFVAKLDATGGGLLYSTYLGGANDDHAFGIALDASGSAVAAGDTRSSDFPVTPGAYDPSWNGFSDGFVAKLDATGGGLLYSTYLGGRGSDDASGLALDGSGNAFVAGHTFSTDFPTTPGTFATTFTGSPFRPECFLAKLDASGGSLAYSTFLGGRGSDYATAIAVDAAGNAFATGWTDSLDFPVTPGAYRTTRGGAFDAFVIRLSAAGDRLEYGTYLGGSASDYGNAIIVDGADNAYVAGSTASSDFPVRAKSYDTTWNGAVDAFVTHVGATGAVLFNTYLGGSGPDAAYSLARDPSANVYVAGYANSTDFPTTPGAYDPSWGGKHDGFVAKLSWTPNYPPTADAGPDVFGVLRPAFVTLDGSASADPEGDALTFSWMQIGGPAVALYGADGARPTFTPAVPGAYRFQLAASDGPGGTVTDAVDVTVLDRAPTFEFPPTPFENGVNPELGLEGDTFHFRIVYTDADGDVPSTGYPRVRVLDGDAEIAGSPFVMAELDPTDTNVTDGKVYALDRPLANATSGYRITFEASDGFESVSTPPFEGLNVLVSPLRVLPIAAAMAITVILLLAVWRRNGRRRAGAVPPSAPMARESTPVPGPTAPPTPPDRGREESASGGASSRIR